MMCDRRFARRIDGFSLIELLVALMIFATMAAIAYAGLSAVTRTHAALDVRERELSSLGRTLALIERDLRGFAVRPVRDGNGASLPAIGGQVDLVELSAYGRGRVAGGDLGLIERIAYQRDGDGLHRLRWSVLDRTASTLPDRRLLLAGADIFRVRFLGADNRWHAQWPLPGATQAAAQPLAVEFTLATPAIGEVRRLVELPGGAQPLLEPGP
jgi:general secretion pathway protein J